jgi:hypothetical protein
MGRAIWCLIRSSVFHLTQLRRHPFDLWSLHIRTLFLLYVHPWSRAVYLTSWSVFISTLDCCSMASQLWPIASLSVLVICQGMSRLPFSVHSSSFSVQCAKWWHLVKSILRRRYISFWLWTGNSFEVFLTEALAHGMGRWESFSLSASQSFISCWWPGTGAGFFCCFFMRNLISWVSGLCSLGEQSFLVKFSECFSLLSLEIEGGWH